MGGCFVWLPNFVPLFVPPDFVLLSSERLVSYQSPLSSGRGLCFSSLLPLGVLGLCISTALSFRFVCALRASSLMQP